MLMGYYAYFGITGNGLRLRWFFHRVERMWYRWLQRRTRGRRGAPGYEMFRSRYALPQPRIVHQYIIASESVV